VVEANHRAAPINSPVSILRDDAGRFVDKNAGSSAIARPTTAGHGKAGATIG
jgi:hypothetical protein